MVDGQKFDTGKTRVELFPGDALLAISQVLTFGAKKYSARNWEQGIAWGRVFGALMRHLWAWWQGESKDPETGLSHLWHAGCCIVFLIAYEERGMTAFDDRPQGRILVPDHVLGVAPTSPTASDYYTKPTTTLIQPKEQVNV